MADYEHFRPYLHARSLRFSYGSVKGRTREARQKKVESLGVARGPSTLERYGFSAIWINRKGYPDAGAAVGEQLRTAGRSTVLAENPEFVCVVLVPSHTPELPPDFMRGWQELEAGDGQQWRRSSGSAALALQNPTDANKVPGSPSRSIRSFRGI